MLRSEPPNQSDTGNLVILALRAVARNPTAYLAARVVLGAGLGASLYDPAFATLGRIFGAAARRPITLLTLAGGFVSMVGWPATHDPCRLQQSS